MLAAYWDTGKMIYLRQQMEGWGAGVIPRLANDLKNELVAYVVFWVGPKANMVQ